MCHSALQERYVNFYTDFAFKKLFGTEANKDLLISFLNSLFDGTEVIKTLNYLNVEHLGHNAAERKAVFDVYCENEKGEKFLIEMQKAEQEYFKDRSIFYSTFPVQEQAPQGRWNFKLNKVYTIGILNFCIDEGNADYMRREVKLMATHTKEVFYDKLTYIYLEMPKFRKTEQELVTDFDKWLYAIKNLATLMERPAALQDAIFQRFFEQAEIAKFNSNDLRSYRESQKDFWDMCAVTETAEKKGRAEGLAEGMEKGRAEGKAELIKTIHANGMTADAIAAAIGFDLAEVEKILNHQALSQIIMKGIYTILLLLLSNVFMTLAWYGHLRLQETGVSKYWPLIGVIAFSWGIAFFEYCCQVPANRIGFEGTGGPFSLIQLKVIQEVVSLVVFTVIANLLFQGQHLQWNHLAAFVCLIAAVYFVFMK